MVQAEVLSKFMTDFHRRKKREVEDAGSKEVEIYSGGKNPNPVIRGGLPGI